MFFRFSVSDLSTCLDSRKGGLSDVKLFHFTGESADSLPSRTHLLQMLMHLSDWRNNNGGGGGGGSGSKDGCVGVGKIAVVSHDGISKIGVFCAAVYCFEQIDLRGVVDVFQAARNVKKTRPQLVTDLTEYKFCYDLVLEFVSKRMKQGII